MKIIAKFLMLICISCLISCAAVPYELPPNPEQSLLSGESLTTIVKAAGPWRSSGVLIKSGEKYEITASGRWRTSGFEPWVGPDGIGSTSVASIVKGYSNATLIAKIGDNPPFPVGARLTLTASTSGLLYLQKNDRILGNCSGQIEATIKNISQSEKPIVGDKHVHSTSYIKEKTTVPSNFQASNSWAVVIGISRYQYSGQNGLSNLIFADDDAKAFARTLRNLGWSESHIKLLLDEDATERNIKIALESWLSKAGPNDQIILFWAGHGFPDPEDPEKVYFACYDTDISIPATGYRMDKVRDALEEKKCKNVVVLADTCHAGKLITRGERGVSIAPQIYKMRQEKKTPKGWIFMVGADTDRKAIEHTSWKNGAFTHCVIEALSGKADGYLSSGSKDGIVTMGELKDYLNSAMPYETQKVLGVAKRPIITTSTGDPDIWNLSLQAK